MQVNTLTLGLIIVRAAPALTNILAVLPIRPASPEALPLSSGVQGFGVRTYSSTYTPEELILFAVQHVAGAASVYWRVVGTVDERAHPEGRHSAVYERCQWESEHIWSWKRRQVRKGDKASVVEQIAIYESL